MKKNQEPDAIMNQKERTAMRLIKYLFCIIVLCTFFTKYNCYSGEKCNNFMTCKAKRLYEDNVDSVLVELKFTNYSNDTSYIEASLFEADLISDSLWRFYPVVFDSLTALGITVEPDYKYKCLNKYLTDKAIPLFGNIKGKRNMPRDYRDDRNNGFFDFSITRISKVSKLVISESFFQNCQGGPYFYVLPQKSLKIVLAFDYNDVFYKWKRQMTFLFDYVYDINVIKEKEPQWPCPYRQCAVTIDF
ncbi:MAG: hypothetical protein ACK5C0_03655 [Candidatus Kapaibacterium sp.]|jgi:hypothetical protein